MSLVAGQKLHASDLFWINALTGDDDGVAQATADSSNISAETVILTVSGYTFAAGYAYRFEVGGTLFGSTGSNDAVFKIRKTNASGTTYVAFGRIRATYSTTGTAGDLGLLVAYGANNGGSDVTADTVLTVLANTGTVTHGGSSTRPRFLRITPCGPAGNFSQAVAIT